LHTLVIPNLTQLIIIITNLFITDESHLSFKSIHLIVWSWLLIKRLVGSLTIVWIVVVFQLISVWCDGSLTVLRYEFIPQRKLLHFFGCRKLLYPLPTPCLIIAWPKIQLWLRWLWNGPYILPSHWSILLKLDLLRLRVLNSWDIQVIESIASICLIHFLALYESILSSVLSSMDLSLLLEESILCWGFFGQRFLGLVKVVAALV
jgi:hypothetical protein